MSIDAMKQALEALEEIADEVFSPYDNKLGDAILALRAAIEQAQPEIVQRAEDAYEAAKEREWQGLTDAEREQFRQWAHPDIIEAIELRLHERNT